MGSMSAVEAIVGFLLLTVVTIGLPVIITLWVGFHLFRRSRYGRLLEDRLRGVDDDAELLRELDAEVKDLRLEVHALQERLRLPHADDQASYKG